RRTWAFIWPIRSASASTLCSSTRRVVATTACEDSSSARQAAACALLGALSPSSLAAHTPAVNVIVQMTSVTAEMANNARFEVKRKDASCPRSLHRSINCMQCLGSWLFVVRYCSSAASDAGMQGEYSRFHAKSSRQPRYHGRCPPLDGGFAPRPFGRFALVEGKECRGLRRRSSGF